MEIELWELRNIVNAAAEEAVKKYILSQEPTKDEMTERQAKKEFGEGWIDNQVALGLVKPIRKGIYKNSKKIFSRSVLMELKHGANPLLRAVTN
jgi:hypothetical protein